MSYRKKTGKLSNTIKEYLKNINKESEFKILQKNVNKYYNCWGFTAFINKWVHSLEWMSEYDIEDMIKKYTKKIRKDSAKTGDIIVFRLKCDNEIEHTATICSDNLDVIHKPGRYKLEVSQFNDVLDDYEDVCGSLRVEYRRIK